MPKRATSTSFKKGQSGNPGGRPKELGEIRELAREHTEAALSTLAKALSAKSERTQVAAAEALLDRGYGKPTQTVDMNVSGSFADLLGRVRTQRSGSPAPTPDGVGERPAPLRNGGAGGHA